MKFVLLTLMPLMAIASAAEPTISGFIEFTKFQMQQATIMYRDLMLETEQYTNQKLQELAGNATIDIQKYTELVAMLNNASQSLQLNATVTISGYLIRLQELTKNYLTHLDVYRKLAEYILADIGLLYYASVDMHREYSALQMMYGDEPHLEKSIIIKSFKKISDVYQEVKETLTAKQRVQIEAEMKENSDFEEAANKLEKSLQDFALPNAYALKKKETSYATLLQKIMAKVEGEKAAV